MKLAYVRNVKIPQDDIELQNDQIARYADAGIEIRETSDG